MTGYRITNVDPGLRERIFEEGDSLMKLLNETAPTTGPAVAQAQVDRGQNPTVVSSPSGLSGIPSPEIELKRSAAVWNDATTNAELIRVCPAPDPAWVT